MGQTLLLRSFFLSLGFGFFFSCQGTQVGNKALSPAFYHWQTHLDLTAGERSAVDSLGVKKLYVKFFDIDWDASRQMPVPLAEVQIDTSLLYGLEIVPTVFITNRTFLNLKMSEVDTLAKRVSRKMARQSRISNLESRITEIQMDCDWTERTREKYFHFLKKLRAELSSLESQTSNHKLSATIRLHQIRYPERTGIPPVDRGMLMAYNMGEVDEWETENSIFDLNILSQYVPTQNYPLSLDLALPIFHWGIAFRPDVADETKLELAYLINGLESEDLTDTARFAKLAPNRYEVRKNTYLEGYYLYKNDRVRLESVSPEDLEKVGDRLAKFLKLGKAKDLETVAFYHLDTSTLKAFDHEKLEKILEKF